MAQLDLLVQTSSRLAQTRSRLAKIELLADCLRQLAREDEVEIGVDYLSGRLRQGRIGLGSAWLQALPIPAAPALGLTLRAVDACFGRLAATTGKGSSRQRQRLLHELFGQATAAEQDFLARLILGELRQGALEGLMQEALATAARLPILEVRRALMVSGDLPAVAQAALREGEAGLARFRLTLFQPLKPMLAQTAPDLATALHALGRAGIEYKLDGARVQVHKDGHEVRVYSRRLNEVTTAVPEIVEAAQALPARRLILDGEAIVLRADGRPQPFQLTMRRFGRRQQDDRLRQELPLQVFFFDCLHAEDEDWLAEPAAVRAARLQELLPAHLRIPRLETAEPAHAQAWLEAALDLGHEGVMVKSLEAPYEAGNRGNAWQKVKLAHSLDLIILAAEWGSGRRRGYLSNLHLGARDPELGWVMLGKTFKGLTDEMLAWQTQRLQALAVREAAGVVYVRPEQVVEVAFDGVQVSPQYPGGVALRFARVKGYRPDKTPDEVDTLATVRAFLKQHESG